MRNEIDNSELDADDVKELAIERAGQIVVDTLKGDKSEPHKLPGIELMAVSIAKSVMDNGARKLAGDFGLDLSRLNELAASQHVSSC